MKQMRPTYVAGFIPNPGMVLDHLLTLDWLRMTEARQEVKRVALAKLTPEEWELLGLTT